MNRIKQNNSYEKPSKQQSMVNQSIRKPAVYINIERRKKGTRCNPQPVAEPGIEPRGGEQKGTKFFVAQKGVYIAKQILHKLQYS